MYDHSADLLAFKQQQALKTQSIHRKSSRDKIALTKATFVVLQSLFYFTKDENSICKKTFIVTK